MTTACLLYMDIQDIDVHLMRFVSKPFLHKEFKDTFICKTSVDGV